MAHLMIHCSAAKVPLPLPRSVRRPGYRGQRPVKPTPRTVGEKKRKTPPPGI